MRKPGRRVTPLTEEQKRMVIEYLESDLTYAEVAEKYKGNINNLKYWVAKYRKEQKVSGKEEDNWGKAKSYS